MATITSTNPAKGYEVIGEVQVSTEAEIKEAVVSARKAFPSWSALAVDERAKYLQNWVDESA